MCFVQAQPPIGVQQTVTGQFKPVRFHKTPPTQTNPNLWPPLNQTKEDRQK